MTADITKATLKTKGQTDLINLINEGLKSGTGPFADIFGAFNEEAFQKGVAKPSLQQFQEEILPQLTEKFRASGGGRGTGFQRELLKAGTKQQSELDRLRYEAQQKQIQNRLQGLQHTTGLNTFENIVQPQQKEESIWSSIIPAAITATGTVLGGPLGGAAANAIANIGKNAVQSATQGATVG